MSITPDTKDWTWVLERECPECGFEAGAVPREEVGGLLLKNAAQWHALLRSDGEHAVRPREDKWSTLEYGAHVRDTCRVYLYRLGLMLEQDDPLFSDWDQNATAVEERYAEQDPKEVADGLVAAAQELAAGFSQVTADQWARKGRRSDGASFTVESIAKYFLHDPVHHWWDVQADLQGGDPEDGEAEAQRDGGADAETARA
jgi:hypothetical protein